MLNGIGPMELTIVFLIVILLVGGRKIPEIAKGLGKGIREFKSARLGQGEPDGDPAPGSRPALGADPGVPETGGKKSCCG